VAKITIRLDTRFDTLEKVLANLGFVRASKDDIYATAAKDIFDPNAYKASAGDAELRSAITEVSHQMVENNVDAIAEFAGSGAEKPAAALTEMDGDRKRGDPSPGRKRRTAAQVEEDHLFFTQNGKTFTPAPVHPEILAMAQGPVAAEVAAAIAATREPDDLKRERLEDANISTGEERVNPEDKPDYTDTREAEINAQDAADEAAETAQRPAGPPTLEDLRATVALYIDKFGHAASVKNMKTIIGCAVADCPVDEIPNAIAKVKAALSGSTVITPVDPSTGKPNEPETAEMFPEPVTASPAKVVDVVEAIKAYARAYDGTDTDQDAMVVTKEDLPKVFSATFGKGVTGMGSLPDKKPETLGKILVAIKAATSENMFERRPYAQAPK